MNFFSLPIQCCQIGYPIWDLDKDRWVLNTVVVFNLISTANPQLNLSPNTRSRSSELAYQSCPLSMFICQRVVILVSTLVRPQRTVAYVFTSSYDWWNSASRLNSPHWWSQGEDPGGPSDRYLNHPRAQCQPCRHRREHFRELQCVQSGSVRNRFVTSKKSCTSI